MFSRNKQKKLYHKASLQNLDLCFPPPLSTDPNSISTEVISLLAVTEINFALKTISEIVSFFLSVTEERTGFGSLRLWMVWVLTCWMLKIRGRRAEVGDQTRHSCGLSFNIFPTPWMVSAETTSISSGSEKKTCKYTSLLISTPNTEQA